ncbi:lys-63-specific deubiquitinase BRCC36-like [Anthonomus grandis grandis]|uniref:lys-63-specific deubiquitinase BRCC36-like n=1 Tax=Anthonomus grandis grandis TaxID=2921223 RepID=UPI00216663B1|nr:lys-63-specific deubiquitinase BRCC36-like [Anthonomus grandis grandis]
MEPDKHLQKVELASDVYAICIQHALITEKQEVMGLLLGEIDEEECISKISACMILHRSDKQPDRVEISPEQLCGASAYAEELASSLRKPIRVIGWYHSHPHITVWPSHVDIKTQANYQMMDPLFVGLIFSVYNSDPQTKSNQVQLTCFQAKVNGDQLERREVPLFIQNAPLAPYNLKQIVDLPKILIQEELEIHSNNDGETNDPLVKLHNDAVKTVAVANIVSNVSIPILEGLTARLSATQCRIKELQAIKEKLLAELKE